MSKRQKRRNRHKIPQAQPLPVRVPRVQIPLSQGHMNVNISPDDALSIAVIRLIGESAIKRMRS